MLEELLEEDVSSSEMTLPSGRSFSFSECAVSSYSVDMFVRWGFRNKNISGAIQLTNIF